MAIVLIRQDGKTASWKKGFQAQSPEIIVYSYEEEHPREAISMAIVWKHPNGSLKAYPNLKCIASFGAGVDFVFEDPDLPEGVPVTRVIDPVLAGDMSEFVLAQILSYLKHLKRYALEQEKRIWHPREYRRIAGTVVGIMGVGALGSVLAEDLKKLGFGVLGWASSKKDRNKIPMYAGEEELARFLSQTTILVCLLPLTTETRGILNKKLFSQLPRGAFVINVARGGHLVDEDLLEMLENGHLSGAALDVFHKEPLPEDHPFWSNPAIHLSPHIASVSDQESVIPQLLGNYERLVNGKPLMNVVSREKGY
jgi:glyoxylate/hydroxypyruvate reductase A